MESPTLTAKLKAVSENLSFVPWVCVHKFCWREIWFAGIVLHCFHKNGKLVSVLNWFKLQGSEKRKWRCFLRLTAEKVTLLHLIACKALCVFLVLCVFGDTKTRKIEKLEYIGPRQYREIVADNYLVVYHKTHCVMQVVDNKLYKTVSSFPNAIVLSSIIYFS